MRIYVIGPVTGVDDLNLPAFNEARQALTNAGFTPLIPHDFISVDAEWQQAMRRSIETLVKADGVACLPGWNDSYGAQCELEIAQELGIPAMELKDWLHAFTVEEIMHDAKTTKYCPHCKRVIPLTMFQRYALSTDGRQAYCRDCHYGYKHKKRDIR